MKLSSHLDQLRKNNAVFSVLMLSGGTAIGQGIVVLCSPILSRLYRPEDFGALAVYASLLGIFTVIAGGRYELAIPLPEREEDAEGLLKVSILCILGTAVVSTVLILLFGRRLMTLMNASALTPFLWLLPIGIIFSGIYQSLNYLIVRRKGFSLIARTRIYQGGGMSGVQLVLGALKIRPLGLFLGQIVGQAAGITSLWRAFRKTRPENPQPAPAAAALAKRYSRFPLLSTWGGLSNSLSMQLPVIILSALFGPIVTGFYALGLRVLQTPLSLFGNAIGQVFFSEAAQARREDRLKEVVEKGFSRLLPLGCSLLLPLAVTAPEVFSIVFGAPWRMAGVYAQMLIPWLLFVFINSPLSTLTTVLERQDGEMVFQSTLLVVRLGALFVGKHFGGAMAALGAFAFVSAVWWAGFTFWNLGLVRIKAAEIVRLFLKALVPLLPAILALLIIKRLCPAGTARDILLLLGTAGIMAAGSYHHGRKMIHG